MGHPLDGGIDRGLEGRLRVFGVIDQVETIRDQAGLEWLAVARGQRRAELGFIGVRGFVQVDMHHDAAAQGRDQCDQRSRFGRRAVGHERTVRIDRLGVPALDALVAPRADAGHDQQIGAPGVFGRAGLQELQRALHAAGFVTVDAAGDQHRRQCGVPVAAAHGKQRVLVRGVLERAVPGHVEAAAQRLDGRQHVIGIAALRHLTSAPLRLLRCAPGLAGGADGIEGGVGHGVLVCAAGGNVILPSPHTAARVTPGQAARSPHRQAGHLQSTR